MTPTAVESCVLTAWGEDTVHQAGPLRRCTWQQGKAAGAMGCRLCSNGVLQEEVVDLFE